MPSIETFYFRGRKAIPQKFTLHPESEFRKKFLNKTYIFLGELWKRDHL